MIFCLTSPQAAGPAQSLSIPPAAHPMEVYPERRPLYAIFSLLIDFCTAVLRLSPPLPMNRPRKSDCAENSNATQENLPNSQPPPKSPGGLKARATNLGRHEARG